MILIRMVDSASRPTLTQTSSTPYSGYASPALITHCIDSLRHPVNTKHLYNICTMLVQRRRRWADVGQMLYKCFVFTGSANNLLVVISGRLFKINGAYLERSSM